jgi:flagellar biosynthetic protein FliQ
MTGAQAIDIARDGLTTMIFVSAPILVVALIIGVVIGLLQALTQIQEMTLVFVPKIVAVFVTTLLALPLMGNLLSGFMARMAARIVSGGG